MYLLFHVNGLAGGRVVSVLCMVHVVGMASISQHTYFGREPLMLNLPQKYMFHMLTKSARWPWIFHVPKVYSGDLWCPQQDFKKKNVDHLHRWEQSRRARRGCHCWNCKASRKKTNGEENLVFYFFPIGSDELWRTHYSLSLSWYSVKLVSASLLVEMTQKEMTLLASKSTVRVKLHSAAPNTWLPFHLAPISVRCESVYIYIYIMTLHNITCSTIDVIDIEASWILDEVRCWAMIQWNLWALPRMRHNGITCLFLAFGKRVVNIKQHHRPLGHLHMPTCLLGKSLL